MPSDSGLLTSDDAQTEDRFRHISFLSDMLPVKAVHGSRQRRPASQRVLRPVDPLDTETAAYFEALCSCWGLCSSHYRSSIFRRRTAATLRALKVADVGTGTRVIAQDHVASERALSAVMIGVTSFFRDPSVFKSLGPLLQRLHAGTGPLSLMSVGCSNGVELYSVAMLLADAGILTDSQLLGIDCRPAAIDAARAAVYPESTMELLPMQFRERYMIAMKGMRVRDRSFWLVDPLLQNACQWQALDAFQLGKTGHKRHAILCRNLAIYLTPESATALWTMLVDQLHPGGLLIVGKAERPPLSLRSILTRVSQCVFKKEY